MTSMLKSAVSVGAVLIAVGCMYRFTPETVTNPGMCPPIDIEFATVKYTDPMPYTDENGNMINFAPREFSSMASITCYPGFGMHNHQTITCGEGGKWSTHERPTCDMSWSAMQIFVAFAFSSISIMLVAFLWRTCAEWNRHHESAARGSISLHHELLSKDGSISEHEMGNHSAIILSIETVTLFLGFSSHFLHFIQDGVWYLNPSQQTMINPGQKHVSSHVFFGFSICVGMAVMAGLIKMERKKMINGVKTRGPLRNTHKFLGEYVIPPIAVMFLVSAVWAELQLPGSIPQKIARNMLTVWVAAVLYFLIKHAWNHNIKAHLHYVVCFWGLVCSAGSLRGMTLLWGYLLGCEYGWGANPCLGIVTGTLFSTLFPMLLFVHWNKTWKMPYARWCIFFAAYYQLLIPLYAKSLMRPCYPRMNMATVYPAYKFPMPREFYESEESFMEAFVTYAAGGY